MKTLPTLVLLSLVALAAPAAAADLTVDLHLSNGTPVRDAVVTLTPTAGPVPAAASRLGGPFQMAQEKIQFHPFVLLVPVGATVAFPNLDKVRHHVYSFSPARTFELKLFGQEDHRTVTFDKPGVVALGCNIHDRMLGYIYVSDTPYAARSDEHGQVQLHNLPEGSVTLKVWHPFLRGVGQTVSRPLTLKADQQQNLTLDLRDPPAAMSGMGG
jgi:plastocyanin